MKSAVGSTGLHPRTTAYCNSDGRFAQIASWQYCSMAWPTLLDCRLRELRRNHCATAGQAQTRTYPGQRSSIGSCVPYRFRLDTGLGMLEGRCVVVLAVEEMKPLRGL